MKIKAWKGIKKKIWENDFLSKVSRVLELVWNSSSSAFLLENNDFFI